MFQGCIIIPYMVIIRTTGLRLCMNDGYALQCLLQSTPNTTYLFQWCQVANNTYAFLGIAISQSCQYSQKAGLFLWLWF